MECILQLKDIVKSFSGVRVLDNIHLNLYPGEIHALLGENGAGKSTTLNILSGTYGADSGHIIYQGEEIDLDSPLQAKKKGIVMVHQELQLIPMMTVYENIFLANEITNKAGIINVSRMIKESDELLKRVDADFSSKKKITELSIAEQQMVEIAKALHQDSKVLILDEPTSSLTNKEIEKLFSIMRNLKAQGKAILFVSHRMEEIYQIADRLTIFRDGKYIDSFMVEGASNEDIIFKFTGRKIQGEYNTHSLPEDSETVLSVKNLKDTAGFIKGDGVSFELKKGEILGFSGLVGSGRSETMRMIFGADKIQSGNIEVFGKEAKIHSIKDSMKLGIGMIPENRKLEGFISVYKNKDNIGISSFDRLGTKTGFIVDSSILKNAKEYMPKLNVKPNDPFKYTVTHSGGNQQKVVLAKWICRKPKILIMDEPTRGVDIGAKEEIYNLMKQLTDQGVSIIMISSELPEILKMSNRIAVMHEGEISAVINREDATEEKILSYAMGGSDV